MSVSPSKRLSWLMNPTRSKDVPSSGWLFYDDKVWQDAPTILVTAGPLPPLARQYKVTAIGAAAEMWADYLGVFTRSDRWWLGRPVYINTEGRFLFHGPYKDGWSIGEKLGRRGLCGSQAHHSPDAERNWRYYDEVEWKPASLTVTIHQMN